MPIILCDIDETVLQCSDFLQQFIADEFNLHINQRLSDHHDIMKLYETDLATTLHMVTAFHRSHWMDKLPPMACASVVLPELHRRGFQFVAISACLNEPDVLAARTANLERAFGFEWDAVHCLGLTPCKQAALDLYEPSIWVDDLARHAMAGAELGHRSFLMHQKYNAMLNHPDVTRVSDWHELARHLD